MSCHDLFHLRLSFPSRNHYICSEEKPARLHMDVPRDPACNESDLQAILMESNPHRHPVKPELNNKQGLHKQRRTPRAAWPCHWGLASDFLIPLLSPPPQQHRTLCSSPHELQMPSPTAVAVPVTGLLPALFQPHVGISFTAPLPTHPALHSASLGFKSHLDILDLPALLQGYVLPSLDGFLVSIGTREIPRQQSLCLTLPAVPPELLG